MMRRLALAILLLGCSAGEPAPVRDQAPAVKAPASPPTAREALDVLLRNANVHLTHASCKGVTGVEGDDTLGDYLAHLLEQLAAAHAEGTPATLTVACDPSSRCRLAVDIKAEDPWRYGIHFDVPASGEIPASTIECPGAA